MLTVAVFFGGESNEHEISVITGMLAVNLLKSKYRVLPVFLPLSGGMQLARGVRSVNEFASREDFLPVTFCTGGIAPAKKPKKIIPIDCALNCCHGGGGEGGTLSALLAWYRIRSASPALAASGIFMDKALTKYALKGLGISVAQGVRLSESEWRAGALQKKLGALGFPLVVKPCKLGSSIGISVAEDFPSLEAALELAFTLDDAALIEEYLPEKRDLNCAAYRKGEEVVLSEIEEVFSEGDYLTFDEKYQDAPKKKSCMPAQISLQIADEIKKILHTIYTEFSLFGVVRADFILSRGRVYLNEVNTVPGSLSCYLFGETLSAARAHIVTLIEEGMRSNPSPKHILRTGILNSDVFRGAKACKVQKKMV